MSNGQLTDLESLRTYLTARIAPARADFRALAHEPPAVQRDKLRRMLARGGRGRAEVAVDVKCHEALVMSFTGTYAVLASARAK